MPSALEILVKILKLEREQGCKNTAVIGGLTAYSATWEAQARDQARKPEHHTLLDELKAVLSTYDELSKNERLARVNYMLDRITGRVPPNPSYVPLVAEAPPKPTPIADDNEESVISALDDDTVSQPSKSEKGHKSGRQTSRKEGTPTLDIPSPPRLARPPRGPRPQLKPEEALAALNELKAPVTRVKGVGKQQAESLEKLNIRTISDMLYHLPRRYDDYTRLLTISKLRPDMVVTVIGTVAHTEIRIGKNNRQDFAMSLDDGSGTLNVIFFGQKFLINTIRKGQQLVLSGKVTLFGGKLQMTNPEWERLDSENLHTVGIVPVYSMTEGLKPRAFRREMKQLVDEWASKVPDFMPAATLDRAELADIGWALRQIHFPESHDHLYHARRRLIFDELILLQLAIMANRRDWQAVPAQPLTVDDGFLDTFIEATFPYQLTNAQQRAIADIRRDIAKNVPMNRLIQGDVGAGKTAVAIVAIAMAIANGKQAALMVPTGILAEQHYRNISENFKMPMGAKQPVIALLTSALSSGERESIYRGIADGSIDIVIGTHALIQESVSFNDLALAIIDEQHRFGVEQRGALRGKGTNPHVLVMTATPIPRTLALTLYADLDLTIIDEKPPNRQPVETRVIELKARERIYSFVESQLAQGRQAFFIHPLVETSDKIDAASAIDAYEQLKTLFHRYRVCLLHGRMKPSEKDEIMAAFARHEYDIMVTTSVAEVGVDVPNASVIVIEGANRFGLAQLHQFRGRVGRGTHQSFCLLVPDSHSPESQERLRVMEETDDGFVLAEHDWRLRGPGDLVGTRQSGQSMLKLAEDMTPEMVTLAQREARTIFEEDPHLQHPDHYLLRQRVLMLYNDNSDIS